MAICSQTMRQGAVNAFTDRFSRYRYVLCHDLDTDWPSQMSIEEKGRTLTAGKGDA